MATEWRRPRPAGHRAARRLALAGTVAAALGGAAGAEAPLSAIDWLSDTVAEPVVVAPGAMPLPAPEQPPAPPGVPDAIATTVLGPGSPDALGVLSPRVSGLPADLWGASPTDELIERIQRERLDPVPALRDLFVTLLLAELDPPHDAGGGGRLLLARIDKLLELGALDQAAALIELVDPPTPDVFRRGFDVALLIGTEDAACAQLRRLPGIAPTFPARVFCLARGGDWQAAKLTLNTAQALGQITPEDEVLLTRFLDAETDEDAQPLPVPARPTPLTLRMFEAIGEPLPTNGLPLAFSHAELSPSSGWKARLDAGERLARAGALAPARLLGLYTERMPAASGGVWTRVDSIQRFDIALSAGDPGAVAAALPRVWGAMQQAELEVPFADLFAERLIRLPLTGDAAALAFRIALLSPVYETAALAYQPGTAAETFQQALARGSVEGVLAPDSMARSIAPAFRDEARALTGSAFRDHLAENRRGEALLFAMERVAEGATGDRRAVTEGLAMLRGLGFEDAARRAALQLLLLERRG